MRSRWSSSLPHLLTGLCAALVLALTGCSPKPVSVVSLSGPDTLNVGESGEFTAQFGRQNAPKKAPKMPVQYNWNFGDGSNESGEVREGQSRSSSVSHAFGEGGTFMVELTATNREGKSEDSETSSVVVVAPPEIVTMQASSTNVETGQRVKFTAKVRGTEPIRYQWKLGGNATSTAQNPTRRYKTPGRKSVALRASNRAGSDRRSVRINVSRAKGPCDRITELHTVHFAFDKSNLAAQAQQRLGQNVKSLKKCPDLRVRVDAYTDHVGTDQYNLRLSERRARSVRDYYGQNGLAASRINTRGLGKAPQPCMEEDPGPGCRRNRRAESIPLRPGN